MSSSRSYRGRGSNRGKQNNYQGSDANTGYAGSNNSPMRPSKIDDDDTSHYAVNLQLDPVTMGIRGVNARSMATRIQRSGRI